MDGLLIIARLLLAAVFAIAGIAKLADRTGAVRSMRDFGLPPALAGPAATLLPLIELAGAIALLPANSSWWGALGVLLLLVVFILGITVSLARGRAPDCHCFGQLHSEPVGWNTVARNVALAVVAAVIVSRGRSTPAGSMLGWMDRVSGSVSTPVIIASIAVALAAFATYVVFHVLRQNGRLLVRLEAIEAKLGIESAPPAPQGLRVDSPAPKFSAADLDGRTVTLDMLLREENKPLLLVFSEPGCGACEGLMPDIARWQRDNSDRLITVVISRGPVVDNRNKIAKWGLGLVLLQKDREIAESYDAAGTPTAVLVANGRIASPLASGPENIRALAADALTPRLRTGDTPPGLELPDLEGQSVSLNGRRGNRTVLLFWNPTCGYCQQMLPDVMQWERERASDALALLVISSGPIEANKSQGFRSRVVLDNQFVAGETFGVSGTPSAMLLDEQGKVASGVAVGKEAVLALLSRKFT
jgi:peroxiredoxin/uncharacterized membrane protein YphA (DoxX/SURF4 family)